jgi:hypothetical protein
MAFLGKLKGKIKSAISGMYFYKMLVVQKQLVHEFLLVRDNWAWQCITNVLRTAPSIKQPSLLYKMLESLLCTYAVTYIHIPIFGLAKQWQAHLKADVFRFES